MEACHPGLVRITIRTPRRGIIVSVPGGPVCVSALLKLGSPISIIDALSEDPPLITSAIAIVRNSLNSGNTRTGRPPGRVLLVCPFLHITSVRAFCIVKLLGFRPNPTCKGKSSAGMACCASCASFVHWGYKERSKKRNPGGRAFVRRGSSPSSASTRILTRSPTCCPRTKLLHSKRSCMNTYPKRGT